MLAALGLAVFLVAGAPLPDLAQPQLVLHGFTVSPDAGTSVPTDGPVFIDHGSDRPEVNLSYTAPLNGACVILQVAYDQDGKPVESVIARADVTQGATVAGTIRLWSPDDVDKNGATLRDYSILTFCFESTETLRTVRTYSTVYSIALPHAPA